MCIVLLFELLVRMTVACEEELDVSCYCFPLTNDQPLGSLGLEFRLFSVVVCSRWENMLVLVPAGHGEDRHISQWLCWMCPVIRDGHCI